MPHHGVSMQLRRWIHIQSRFRLCTILSARNGWGIKPKMKLPFRSTRSFRILGISCKKFKFKPDFQILCSHIHQQLPVDHRRPAGGRTRDGGRASIRHDGTVRDHIHVVPVIMMLGIVPAAIQCDDLSTSNPLAGSGTPEQCRHTHRGNNPESETHRPDRSHPPADFIHRAWRRILWRDRPRCEWEHRSVVSK
jgi:hypothetical protein